MLPLKPAVISGVIGLLLTSSVGIMALRQIQLIPDHVTHNVQGAVVLYLNVDIKGLEKLKPIPGRVELKMPDINVNVPSDFTGKLHVDDPTVHIKQEGQ